MLEEHDSVDVLKPEEVDEDLGLLAPREGVSRVREENKLGKEKDKREKVSNQT